MPAVGGPSIHGEFSSADASALTEANSRFALYGQGATTSLTLLSTDQVVVMQLSISVGASALTVQVYDGADNSVGSGEELAKVNLAANTTTQVDLTGAPHFVQVGSYPKVKTSGAGQVDVILHGVLNNTK